jgi:hypothetical protein
MFRYWALVWGIVVGAVLWGSHASAGWVIEQTMKGNTEGGRQQIMLQANKMKTLVLGADGKPAAAFILDLDAQTITQVDFQRRLFATATVEEYSALIKGAQQAASEQIGKAMKEMQDAMKDMPPEQRKMMEQMMKSQMGGGAETKECREPQVEVRKTGEQATVAGHAAVRYDVIVDGTPQTELWVAKAITAWRELDPRKLERVAAELGKLAGCGPGQSRQRFLGADPTWKLASEGYPVRTVERSSGMAIEVVKAESRTVPATEFQPPAGFARKALRELMMGK